MIGIYSVLHLHSAHLHLSISTLKAAPKLPCQVDTYTAVVHTYTAALFKLNTNNKNKFYLKLVINFAIRLTYKKYRMRTKGFYLRKISCSFSEALG